MRLQVLNWIFIVKEKCRSRPGPLVIRLALSFLKYLSKLRSASIQSTYTSLQNLIKAGTALLHAFRICSPNPEYSLSEFIIGQTLKLPRSKFAGSPQLLNLVSNLTIRSINLPLADTQNCWKQEPHFSSWLYFQSQNWSYNGLSQTSQINFKYLNLDKLSFFDISLAVTANNCKQFAFHQKRWTSGHASRESMSPPILSFGSIISTNQKYPYLSREFGVKLSYCFVNYKAVTAQSFTYYPNHSHGNALSNIS